jgi:hypothetical protein
MNLLEMFNDDPMTGYRTEKDDNTPVKLSDLRKTKLTIKQINRLRIMNDVRKLEYEQKLSSVRNQYATTAAAPGPM